ncbi:MAG: hypothetical protein CMJ78_02885 [Planctomycetaceae bacterium]|nr:hypothetical protein [Planctomycetaceae bacterium]
MSVLPRMFCISAITWLAGIWIDPSSARGDVDFSRQVAPVLRKHCLRCHHSDVNKGGFAVSSKRRLHAGGDSGDDAIVPGDPDKSPLLQRILSRDESDQMPPTGPRVTQENVELIRQWIKAGANTPKDAPLFQIVGRGLWSLQPLAKPDASASQGWATNEVDIFIKRKLDAAKLSHSTPADKHTLLRRVYLVMHGMPPTPKQINAFVNDNSPNAYERVVDEILKSPRYGERWAQHWLDCVRFAESTGYEINGLIDTAYHYRDYVIRSLNEDKPYDQFIIEQIAGDTLKVDAATGFLVAGPDDGNKSPDPLLTAMQRQDTLDETIKSTSAVMLGLTLGCARCHDHKFDPLTQKDYYAMQAVFAGLSHGTRRMHGPENDRMQAAAKKMKPKLEAAQAKLKKLHEQSGLKPPIDFREYTETLKPTITNAIQMRINAANDSGIVELDDIEVWTIPLKKSEIGPELTDDAINDQSCVQCVDDGFRLNVAHRDWGATADSSPTAKGNQAKTPDTLIDGTRQLLLFFRSRDTSKIWIKIKFAGPYKIDRIVIKPRGAKVPVDYQIDVRKGDQWKQVINSQDRFLHPLDQRTKDVKLTGLDEQQVTEVVKANTTTRSLRSEYNRLNNGPQIHVGQFQTPHKSHLLTRGDPFQKEFVVHPNIPAVLGDLRLRPDATESQRRLALAKGIASPKNPLTARVMVNRLWQHHFGVGIVDTPSDFGFNGSLPTHPELLDWLAGYLIDNKWSLKALHRKILLSSTFRQRSETRTRALKQDADSRLLWRFPPRRLEAEALRDSILTVSGKLNLKMYGPGFSFFEKSESVFARRVPLKTFDKDGWRRMIYGKKIRLESVGIFGSFDCPDASQMSPKRSRSTTAIQALSLFNSEFISRQAGFFADAVKAAQPKDVHQQIDLAFLRALGRSLRDDEKPLVQDVVEKHGFQGLCRILLNMNEFVFVN